MRVASNLAGLRAFGYRSGMQLPGRLSSTTLGDLLGALFREQAKGALEIVERTGRVHRVFLDAGRVTAVELDRESPTLGDLLRRERVLDDDTMRRSLLRALAQRRLHGEVLVSDFHLSEDLVGRVVRTQMSLRLAALERIGDSELRFRVAVRMPREAVTPALSPETFLHGRKRKRDEIDRTPRAWPVVPTECSSRRDARRVLGVPLYATTDDVKRAYRALVRQTHPDLHPRATLDERRELGRKLAAVTSAYQALVA